MKNKYNILEFDFILPKSLTEHQKSCLLYDIKNGRYPIVKFSDGNFYKIKLNKDNTFSLYKIEY